MDRFRRFLVQFRDFRQFLHRRVFNVLYRLKVTHQGLSAGRTHTGNIVQNRLHLGLAPQGAMIFNGEAVGLVLNPGNQLETLGMRESGSGVWQFYQIPGPSYDGRRQGPGQYSAVRAG